MSRHKRILSMIQRLDYTKMHIKMYDGHAHIHYPHHTAVLMTDN